MTEDLYHNGVQPFQVLREWEKREEDAHRMSTWKYDDLWRAACSAKTIIDCRLNKTGFPLKHHIRQMNESWELHCQSRDILDKSQGHT